MGESKDEEQDLLNAALLPTILEGDGDGNDSSSTIITYGGGERRDSLQSTEMEEEPTPPPASLSVGENKSSDKEDDDNDDDDHDEEDEKEASSGKKENKNKKKKKKHKKKTGVGGGSSGSVVSREKRDTSVQQSIGSMQAEMKQMKDIIQDNSEKINSALDFNLNGSKDQIKRLKSQVSLLRGNMQQLDKAIESQIPPKRMLELGRIREVQQMVLAIADEKDKTISMYEMHARRGFTEIERLREDLDSERKEVAELRKEIERLREERKEMINSNPPIVATFGIGGGGVGGPRNSLDDEASLQTSQSYDTVTYEVKSLKKRILHMKKKLTLAQMGVKEAEELRAEVERVRLLYETEKKNSQAKDQTIKRLQDELNRIKMAYGKQSGNSDLFGLNGSKGTPLKWW